MKLGLICLFRDEGLDHIEDILLGKNKTWFGSRRIMFGQPLAQ